MLFSGLPNRLKVNLSSLSVHNRLVIYIVIKQRGPFRQQTSLLSVPQRLTVFKNRIRRRKDKCTHECCSEDGGVERVDISCSCKNCLQGPPAEKTGRGSLLNRPSCPPDDPIGQGTELN